MPADPVSTGPHRDLPGVDRLLTLSDGVVGYAVVTETAGAGAPPWLTDVANGINGAGSGWGATALGLSVVALTMAFRRWRHLLVFLGSVLFLEFAGTTPGGSGRRWRGPETSQAAAPDRAGA